MSFLSGRWDLDDADHLPTRQVSSQWPDRISDVLDMTTLQPINGWTNLNPSTNGTALAPTVEAGVVNALQEECGRTAKEHGFSNDWLAADWLDALAEHLSKESRFSDDEVFFPHLSEQPPFSATTVSTCDALQLAASMLRTNILGMKMMLIVSELSEALESLRHNGGAEGALNGQGNVPEELADTIVRVLDTGTFIKANLGDELLKKMAINRDRPYMHGGKAV